MALVALLTMHFDVGRGHLFNYASLRLIWLVLFFWLSRAGGLYHRCDAFCKVDQPAVGMDGLATGGSQKAVVLHPGGVDRCGNIPVRIFSVDIHGLPDPTTTAILLGRAGVSRVMVAPEIVYAQVYRERASLAARLRSKWDGLLPVQRKVIMFLAIVGLVYFLAFIPFNLLRNEYGKFYLLQDEQVIYPDVVQALAPQANFGATVQNVLGSWNWAYGYPYLPISASVLIIPRLIFGAQFAYQVQLNIFLMRQFVSVLPMVLALMLAVYLVTRYKSTWISVSLFAFLLLIPGVVKICYRFWHPDSIILLLVLMTIFFLDKDDLRFGRYFYLAAVACGLTTAIKLWGLFFFLAIAGYLMAGLIQHKISFKKFFLSGLLFILVMLGTFIITSPSMLVPYVARAAAASWTDQQNKILLGPERIDTSGIYKTGLMVWLKYFGQHFMKAYFFFFASFAMAAGALWGSRKKLSRILLAWSLPVTLFLAYFSTMKSFQYMLPVAIPLYCGAALFPEITGNTPYPKWLGFLENRLPGKLPGGSRWRSLPAN